MTVDMDCDVDLLNLPPPPEPDDVMAECKSQFAQANASLVIAGWNNPADIDTEIQQAVITGCLSADDAVAIYIKYMSRGKLS